MYIRHDWALPEVRALHDLPLLELVHRAQTVHREAFQENKVQLCSLLSIKTGGCPEDCAYCPQAARYHTFVPAEPLMETSDVLAAARSAREAGATRFCMGAAWREVKDGPQFDRVLEMVRMIATARLLMPRAMVRLSAGRMQMNAEAQLLCMMAGANSIFFGEKLLTTGNPDLAQDMALLAAAGIEALAPQA